MKKFLKLIVSGLFIFSFFIEGNKAVAQYSSVFQSAKSVGKGNGEATLLFTGSRGSYEGESYKLFDDLGLMGAFGITNNTEVRVRYDRLGDLNEEFFGEYGINSLMFGPKFSTESGIFAIFLPIGFLFADGIDPVWNADPTLILSLPLGEKLMINFSPHYNFSLEEGEGLNDGILGLNLGLGINAGSNWIIRPEGGISFPVGYDENYYYFGLGITRSLGNN